MIKKLMNWWKSRKKDNSTNRNNEKLSRFCRQDEINLIKEDIENLYKSAEEIINNRERR